MKIGLVITTSQYTREFLADCLNSIKSVKYPILIVSNGGYNPSEVIKSIEWDGPSSVDLIINDENGWELGGIRRGKEVFDVFTHIMDSTLIKDISMFDRLFEFAPDENVVLTKGNFHYQGRFISAKLPNLPQVQSKDVAIMLEAHWLKFYREFRPDLPVQSEIFEVVHGQRRMRLENEFMVKWKGTFQRAYDVEQSIF
jgi:hypothetical protein